MGSLQRVKVKDREIAVRTVSFLDWMDFPPGGVSVAKLMRKCISREDEEYLRSLDFENSPDDAEAMARLIKATMEVNPTLFKDFLQKQASAKTAETSTSGQPKTSDGNPQS